MAPSFERCFARYTHVFRIKHKQAEVRFRRLSRSCTFLKQGCYGPSMRKRPRGAATADFDGDKSHLNAGHAANMENNLPTPHSPTPLVGNSGF